MLGGWKRQIPPATMISELIPRKIMLRYLFFILTVLCASASAQQFKKGGEYSPYGPMSPEARAAFIQNSTDPEQLRNLKNWPLEEIFDGLIDYSKKRLNHDSREREFAAVAGEVLFNHSDFENFMYKILQRRLNFPKQLPELPLREDGSIDISWDELLRLKVEPVDASKRKDVEILMEVWPRLLGVISDIPSPEMRIRLMGPCLKGTAGWVEIQGSHTQYGLADEAAGIISGALKQLTGKGFPYYKGGNGINVAVAREWWAKNESKYAWTPPPEAPRPTNEHQAKPGGNRLGTTGNAPTKTPPQAPSTPAGTPSSAPEESSDTFLILAIAAVLAALALSLWFLRKPTK